MNTIGIVGQEHWGTWGVKTNYMAWAEQFGIPVVLYPSNWENFKWIYSIDALILPGGADVSSKRYTWLPHPFAGGPNPFLESFDMQVLPHFVGEIPIFGICRGLQTLNVHLGGSLFQHLWRHPYSKSDDDVVHEIKVKGQDGKLSVNSFQHQAIKKLGDDVVIEAVADDGVIEAISVPERKIFAVQWHPERLLDEYSVEKFKEILQWSK